ncbi:hypothetical protein LTR95_004446, partial [Oleoguttula sp. CCFEE 5521]
YSAYQTWRRICTTPGQSEYTFCNKNFLSPQNLANIEDLKAQLLSSLSETGFVSLSPEDRQALSRMRHNTRQRSFVTLPSLYTRAETNDDLLNAITAWSFYPKLAKRDGKGWRNVANAQSLGLHPTSINKSLPSNSPIQYLSYYSIMQSASRFTNAQETSPVSDFALVLMAGDAAFNIYAGVIVVDGNRLRFKVRDWRSIHVNVPEQASPTPVGAAASDATKERFDTYEDLLVEKDTRHAVTQGGDLDELHSLDNGPGFSIKRRRTTSASGWVPYMMNIVKRSKELQQDSKRDPKALEEAERWLAYVPLVVEPQESPLEKSLPVPWALRLEERRHLTASQLLDEEIRRFAAYIALTEVERKARERILAHTTAKLKPVLKGTNGHYYVFGSMATGTALPFSDIDIGVSRKGSHFNGAMYSPLQRLYNDIVAQNDYMCTVFRGGRFPIMTAQHADSGVDVQVIAGDENTEKNRMTTEFLDSIPNARPLYAVVRTMLGMRGFIDPFVGGISAYGAMHMLFASLLQPPTIMADSPSAASQLQHFLSFFATFDTEAHGLAVRPSETFPKTDPIPSTAESGERFTMRKTTPRERLARTSPLQPYLLCLEDPAKPDNDLGARVTAIRHILATIKALSEDLTESMGAYDAARTLGQSVEGDFSLLLPLVGRCHEVYAERRAKLVTYETKMQERDRIKKLRDAKTRAVRTFQKIVV